MSDDKKPGVGVGVMILNSDDQVLLGLRHEEAEKADSELHGEGTWTMPGGKLDFHEGLKNCVERETKEENGLDLNNLKLVSVTNDTVHDNHFVTIGFLCKDFEGEPEVREPDQIVRWKWFDLKDLPENMFPPSRKIVDNYLSGSIYQDG